MLKRIEIKKLLRIAIILLLQAVTGLASQQHTSPKASSQEFNQTVMQAIYGLGTKEQEFAKFFTGTEKPDINYKDMLGRSLLYIAVQLNRITIAEILIKHGADIDSKTDTGQTALMAAVELRNLPMVKLLTANGANVNEKDDNGKTPLLFLSRSWDQKTSLINRKIATTLLAHGANVNVKNGLRTPLMEASEAEDKELVRLLVSAGADPEITTIRKMEEAVEAGEKDRIFYNTQRKLLESETTISPDLVKLVSQYTFGETA